MIDHISPENWKELESKVAEIFKDIGYQTKINKKIQTVRGPVNVDVYARDKSQSPNIIYLCECKHWEKRTPKNVVHSFRTVVQDYGANFGIIISDKGFQKGAYEASKNTNIKLVDWFGFQDLFEEKWLPAIVDKIYTRFADLVDFTPNVSRSVAAKLEELDSTNQVKFQRFKELYKKYMSIGQMIMGLQPGWELSSLGNEFPFEMEIPSDNVEEAEKVEIHSWREWFNQLVFWAENGLKEIRALLSS